MTVSLIITTYNWPEALVLSIKSALVQTCLPNEIIIADDGSDEKTKEVIKQVETDIPLIHSWQEDDGFRLASSRNKAIAKSNSEYIIIIDGDMILEKHFIEDHLACLQKGCYLQGSRVLLTQLKSQEVLKNGQVKFTLLESSFKNHFKAFRIPVLSKLLCRGNQKTKGIRGCNFSFFKEDILKVNGFNESFKTWGREDSEFIQRLYHIGIKRKNIKFSAIQYHLYHVEGSSLEENDAILQKTIDERLTWCTNGINKYFE